MMVFGYGRQSGVRHSGAIVLIPSFLLTTMRSEPVRASHCSPSDLNLVLLNADCDVHFHFPAEDW